MSTIGWFESSLRRLETSFQIGEASTSFLSDFDADEYVRLLQTAQADATCFYASSHGGHCFWPTRTGYPHPSLGKRDILGEVLEKCRSAGIHAIVYYSVIFNDHMARIHPDWRIVKADGEPWNEWFANRCMVCCPNSAYRDFVVAQLEELCTGYEFDGLWADMTFWPGVCYCSHCRSRYHEETGATLPAETVGWQPQWARFQRKREAWLTEFASLVTATVKRLKPHACVAHQGAAFSHAWTTFAPSLALAKQSDYLNHDFYGDSFEQSFFCKLFARLSESPRFEYITPAYCRRELTSVKTQRVLERQAFMAAAHGGAVRFYDDPFPSGAFEASTYERIGRVYAKIREMEPLPGGELCADAALYVNFESDMPVGGDDGVPDTFDGNSVEVYQQGWNHLPLSARCLAQTLLGRHVLHTVITKKHIGSLDRYRILFLSNVHTLDDEEAEAIRQYVKKGGCLYASKYSSLFTPDGRMREDFALADVFGVSFEGETESPVTFVAPGMGSEDIFAFHTPKHPLTLPDRQVLVRAHHGAEVLATVALPVVHPRDSGSYGQIHVNHPGTPTSRPSLVLNRYGSGQAIYAAGVLEAVLQEVQLAAVVGIAERLANGPWMLETDAPPGIEILAYRNTGSKQYVLHVVDAHRSRWDRKPARFGLSIRVGTDSIKSITSHPGHEQVAFDTNGEAVQFVLHDIESYAILIMKYE